MQIAGSYFTLCYKGNEGNSSLELQYGTWFDYALPGSNTQSIRMLLLYLFIFFYVADTVIIGSQISLHVYNKTKLNPSPFPSPDWERTEAGHWVGETQWFLTPAGDWWKLCSLGLNHWIGYQCQLKDIQHVPGGFYYKFNNASQKTYLLRKKFCLFLLPCIRFGLWGKNILVQN